MAIFGWITPGATAVITIFCFSTASCRPTLLVYAVKAALEALKEEGPLQYQLRK